MRLSYSFICVLSLVFVSFSAKAEVYTPVTAWQAHPLVEATAPKNAPICVISSKFNNGIIIRFTGNSEKIAGFTITGDLNENITNISLFLPGTDNLVSQIRRIDNYTVMGKFFDPVAVYKILSLLTYNSNIRIKVDDLGYVFAGGDINAGIIRMQKCLNGDVDVSARMISRDVIDNKKAAQMPTVNKNLNEAIDSDGAISFEADITLSGVDDQEINVSTNVMKPVKKPHNFEVANKVDNKIEYVVAARPLDVEMFPLVGGEGLSMRKHEGKDPVYVRRNDSNVGAVDYSASIYKVQKWRALKGASLKQVLGAWCEDAEIKLVWNIDGDYALRKSISINSTFSDSVEILMRQYANDLLRPYSKIYFDKVTNSGSVVVSILK